jgi:signal transduction histidine kinase
MFKSVFMKYIAAFMLITLISFAVLTSIIASLVNNYGVSARSETLQYAAYAMSTFIEKDFKNSNQTNFGKYVVSSRRDIQLVMSTLNVNVNAMIIIVTDSDGIVYSYGGSDNTTIADKAVPVEGDRYIVSSDVISNIEESGGAAYSDTMDGFFNSDYVTYAYPVYSNGELAGVVFAATNDLGVDTLVGAVIKTIIMSSLWIMLATLVAVYFISEKITSPIRSMSAAAKDFASGKFDARVEVSGNDEVAELAKAFNNMAASLQSLEDMRRSFIANVSHELRTPMTTIGGFVDSILEGAIPPEKQQHYLEVVSSEVKRLSRLVTTLLDISKMQAGERKFTMTDFDVCELARRILISSEQKIEAKHLDVSFECDNENMIVHADEDAIHQVIYNIVDNALKFVKERGKLGITIEEKDKKIRISVFNEGDGIPAEDLPFVFDRFYKTDKSRSMDKTGVGLGLYIVRTIVEAHGEQIWVESEQGSWCRFTFNLPRGNERNLLRIRQTDAQQ